MLTNKQIKQANEVIELIKQGELTISNRQLQKVLDAFFASGTVVDVHSYNLLLWMLLRLDVNECFKVAGKIWKIPGLLANQQTFDIIIDACIRTKRLEEAVKFVNQVRIVRYSPRDLSKIYDLLELCYSKNNIMAARVCKDILHQVYVRNGGGKNESGSQYDLMGRLLQLNAWLAER